MRRLILFVAFVAAASSALADQITSVTFTQRSRHSGLAEQIKRLRWEPAAPVDDYDLAAETFTVYTPAPPQAGVPPRGLIVWINADEGGKPPEHWKPVLDKHNLVWVGADRTGNTRSVLHRIGLALDAAHNMTQRHTIDPERVYIAGVSGGGRVASWTGLSYADVFAGTFCIVGVDFFTPIPSLDPKKADHYWPKRFGPPPGTILNRARKTCRFVLLTGEHDANREQTQSTHVNGLVRYGFQHATYLEVPGMGHTLPDATWFEKGVQALEP